MGTSARKGWSRKDDIRAGLTQMELMSAVCGLLCDGLKVAKISAKLNEDFPGLELTREEPYSIIQTAATRGLLEYCAPFRVLLEDRIKNLHPWLDSIRVVQTTIVAHVARHAAAELLRIIRARCHAGAKTVRVGLAGGHSMRRLAQELAIQLCEPVANLPEEIWFHALATGYDPEDPTTDPNAFVTFFQNVRPVIQVRARFRGLSAPAMVRPGDLTALRELEDISDAFKAVDDLDIIVTSGSRWRDEDGALHRRMRAAGGADKILDREKCVGDVLWRPIARTGPIVTETELRALTLVELTDLPRLIKQGKKVLLMLAPCGMCHEPKGELLDTILNLDPSQQIVTNVVVDSVTAGQMLRSR